ncbi:MAG: DNA (cytosine-5-)-methyltransferase [Bacteroidales bacterium]
MDREVSVFYKNYVNLKRTSLRITFANDISREAMDVWTRNFNRNETQPDVYHLGSIVDLVRQHHSGIKVFPDVTDIVTGGFPCQDFSLAGKRRGFNSHRDHRGNFSNENVASIETRGKLYMWMKEVIEITKPRLFIAENVRGLVNLENVKEIIRADFASSISGGYIVLEPMVLNAADYGVPQSRERVFFIGIRKDCLNPEASDMLTKDTIPSLYYPYPVETHDYNNRKNGLLPYLKTGDIFEGLLEPELSDDLSHMHFSRAKFMGQHCQGQIEVNPDSVSPTIRSEHHGNIEFRRLSPEHGGKIIKEECNNGLNERRLTPRECGLLQTFPPDFEFVIKPSRGKPGVSASAAYKVIGNAVPPLLAYRFARRIEEIWDLYFRND